MSIVIYMLKVSLALLLCWELYWTAFIYWLPLYSLILPLLKLQWNTTMVAVADIWSPGTVLLIVYLAVALSFLVRSALRFRRCLLQMVFHLSFPSPITGKETTHKGIDVTAPTGTSVFATEDGYATFYAHMDEIGVESGTKVRKGEVIGRVGSTGQSTGPHLHYEVRLDGNHLNPADFY